MKKILAAVLALVMLLPMCMVTQAAEPEKKPFYTVTWGNFSDDFSNVYYMPQYWSNPNVVKKGTAHISWGTSDIPALAEKTKAYFDEVPEGARFINFNLHHAAHHNLNEDACFLEKTIPLISGWLETFLAEYSRIGGKLDGLVIDVEYLDIYAYYIEKNYDNSIYKKIVDNPTYAEKIRPKLVERGFKFYENANDVTPEIFSINSKAGTQYSNCSSIWDAVLKSYSDDCITESCAPLWKYYPDAIATDYTSHDADPWLKPVGDGGGVSGGGGKVTTAGNSSNESFYTVRPNTNFNANGAYTVLPGYNKAVYETSLYGMFKYETYVAKTVYLGSDNGNVDWWYAPYVYNKNATSPYYTETLYHLGMLNPAVFLGYLRREDCKNDDDLWFNTLTIANQAMEELTRIVGYADRKPLAVNPTFNGDYVLSGMYAGGKNYWRITPDNTKISLENFKLDAADPTFSVGGQTIKFPGGKIIADSEIFEIGSCGYWVETAADVTPVVTYADNFYREYPAYGDDFESYAAGTEYNYKNALPADSWEVKKTGSGSAGTVVADPANASNKVLEIKGTFALKNFKMPANVRAGDTYAERQAWEVSFTLPSNMAADAELILLNAANEKKKCNDGGFKIAGNKVYYSQNGEYVELAGVTLTAGTKYTVIREFDFSVTDAYTCNYSIYAGDTLLGQAKKVAIEALVLPVYGAGISCANVAGGGVLLDDLKLYQTAVATDFYLYHSDTGMRITDMNQAVSGDVTYRLSYLNTTKTEKSYTLMAAYYDGETLVSEEAVKEIKFAPYESLVLTGNVENKQEGKTMRVYLKDNNPAEGEEVPEAPTQPEATAPTTPSAPAEEPAPTNNKMIIIIAAAAAVVVIAVVVVVVVASKKKKNAAPAEPATEEPPAEKAEE